MDTVEKIKLITRPPTSEVVTYKELDVLFASNERPKHYIGLEISGFLHLGSLISTGYKINDFANAGMDCTVFLADWHTMINDKIGGDMEKISIVSNYYEKAFKTVCPRVSIIRGSELYDKTPEYWTELVKFARHMPLARTMRALTIMGRTETENTDLAKLLYPAMQAMDIRFLDVDVAHSGMDQRKIHMLVRDIFPKMNWKVPVAIHHSLLPGLSKPANQDESKSGKMSKSNPDSGIFMHDDGQVIRSKIKKAWCEVGVTENNPLLEIVRQIIFHENKEITVERPEKFGGNVTYTEFEQIHADYASSKLHPGDLKDTVSKYLVPIVTGLAQKISLGDDVKNAILDRST
ncbi:MAG: tyrosyl-tRNA synthetase [Cenarchaeum symbiont of Oopsacas minuta]|nr:tyrosyl-tRNA synthetase [Cenarchaeum symbiont of Oopsacas minuta]